MINAGNNFDYLSPLAAIDAPAIMRMLAASGIEVIGVGPFELGLDEKLEKGFFRRLVARSPVNVVLANGPGYLPYVRLRKDGLQVLVTSVIDPAVVRKYGLKVKVSDPLVSLRRVLGRVRHDLAIVVIHASKQRILEIAGRCRGIDLVIDGKSMGIGSNFKQLGKKRDQVPVIYNNKRGQYVCYLDLVRKNGGRVLFNRPVKLKAGVKQVSPDPGIEKMVAAYNRERAAFFARRKQEKFQRYMRDNPPNMFLGDRGCVRCHADIRERWRKTRHARALESLKRRQRANDGICLQCHTTGSGFENTVGGFVSVQGTPWMVNVQCEACHGPGARHAQRPGENRMKKVDEKSCTRCHDYDNDPDFDFEQKWRKISH